MTQLRVYDRKDMQIESFVTFIRLVSDEALFNHGFRLKQPQTTVWRENSRRTLPLSTNETP